MRHSIRKTFSYILFLTTFVSLSCFAAGAPVDSSLAPMLQKVLPSIVNIRAQVKLTDFMKLNRMQEQQQRKKGAPQNNDELPDHFLSMGSGVIVDANQGYIVTNAHVLEDAEVVTVTLGDGRHYPGKIIGADKPSDIALLQIKAKDLTAIPIGDSNNLKVGDLVAAIGNPFGLNQSVTSGIVSALGRTTLGIENFENFIQTDAPINPGNSGGGLINMQGQLIGINTAILAPSQGSIGIGFAIPSNMAKSVVMQLIQYGNVHRGMLGVGAQDVTPELAAAFNLKNTKGSVVTLVMSDSPAKKAGFEVGDIITAINGSEVKNANDVVNSIGFLRVDSKATVNILRNGNPMTLTATLNDPKKRKQDSEATDPFLYGVSLKDFSISSPVHGDVKGVLVVTVEEDSNAWHADLLAGDIITSANHQKVSSIEELKKITTRTKDAVLLNVLRGGGAIFLIIKSESE